MLVKIRHTQVKVRRPNSHKFQGEAKFTGSVFFKVVGMVDGTFVRLSLGTEDKSVAVRRIAKLEKACAEGSSSSLWPELEQSLPVKTFRFFASRVGYVGHTSVRAKSTWADLCAAFEVEMQRLIENKARGASAEEGVMAEGTRIRYGQTIRQFTAFLENQSVFLNDLHKPIIEMFKVDRLKKIAKLAQSRGGSSIALDIAILHRIFAFAVEKQMMAANPISLKHESKPGKNPKNGARPFTAAELAKLRKEAGDDLFNFLFLRWTGLRGSDAVSVRWQDIHFDRGANGEVEKVTQKRGKLAIVPLSTELREQLEDVFAARKPRLDDQVLLNPDNGRPFAVLGVEGGRKRLYQRMKALGERAGVRRVTPHCFRDTFACDMLAREVGIFEVAKMLADTADTIEKHYAQFVPAARDAVQVKMDSGIGIEERAKLSAQRGRKVVAIS